MSPRARYGADRRVTNDGSNFEVDANKKGRVTMFNGKYGFVSDGTRDYFFHRKDVVAGTIPHTQKGNEGPSVTFIVGDDELKRSAGKTKAFAVHVEGASPSDNRADVLSDAYIDSAVQDSSLASVLKALARAQHRTGTSVLRLVSQLAATDVVCHVKDYSAVLMGFAPNTPQHLRVLQAEELLDTLAEKLGKPVPKPVFRTGSTLGITFVEAELAAAFIKLVNDLKQEGKSGLTAAQLDPIRWRESQIRYQQSSRSVVAGNSTQNTGWTRPVRGFSTAAAVAAVSARTQPRTTGPRFFPQQQEQQGL